MAQRAADVADEKRLWPRQEGPAADLAARLRAADERIFEQRAEMATRPWTRATRWNAPERPRRRRAASPATG